MNVSAHSGPGKKRGADSGKEVIPDSQFILYA